MPTQATRTAQDWLQGSLRGGAHPLASGGLSLAPKDFVGGFATPETDGIPSGWSMPLPSDISGHAIFAGTVEGSQDTVSKQNANPHPLSASHWVGSRPIIRGQRPVNKLYQVSVPRPPKPVVESVPTTDSGFPAGTPKVAYAEIAGGGLETQLSGFSEVTVSEGNGINITLPGELSADRVGIAIYVSYGGTGAFRKVRNLSAGFLDSGARNYTLTEYRQGAKPPSENRTQLGQGKQGRPLRFGRGKFTLSPGEYRWTYTRVTRFGESLGAPWSDRRNILEANKKRALWIPHVPQDKGSVGVNLYVEVSGQVYKVRDRSSNVPHFTYAFLRNRGVDIYGASDESTERPAARAQGFPRFSLIQQDLPEEDTSGLEGPASDAQLELEAKGPTLPEPGRRFYQTAYLSDEGQGPTSPFTRHDTPTGSIPRVTLSHPVNILKNAELIERKPNGTPVAWSVRNQAGAGQATPDDGMFTLSNLGTPASDTKYIESEPFAVNSLNPQTVRGVIETQIVSGSAQILLFAYNSSGVKLSETIVAELSASGRVPAKKVFGPTGTALPANAATGTYVIRMSGATRNMRIDVSEMAVHPFEGAPRKASNLYVDNEDADYNPPPETPFHVNGHTGFGLPPAVYQATPDSGLIERVDFEDGLIPWTQSASGVNLFVDSSAALSGAYGLRVGKAAGANGSHGYISKDFGQRSSLAVRHIRRIGSAVSGTNNRAQILEVRDVSGTQLAVLFLSSEGVLEVRTYDINGNRYGRDTVRVPEGSVMDVEVVTSGANSSEGSFTVLFGLNGRTRSVIHTQTGLDWRGIYPQVVDVGVTGLTSNLAGFSFDVDDIAVTERGDVLSDASAPPAGMNPEPPDRPQNTDGSYRETNANENAIRQFYAYVLAGEERYAPTSERYAVLPEETYYPAIYARSDSEECEPWRVVCYTADGASVDMGPLWSAGPSQPWADRSLALTIPSDCVELQFVGQRLAPGEYVAQEPALSWRVLDRSAGYVEQTGGFTVTLPYNPEDTYYNPSDGDGWRELGLAHEGNVLPRFRSGSNLLTWSEYTSDPALVPENSYAQIDGELSAGEEAPLIPSGGAYLSYDLTRPTLLQPDGSPLPGGAVVGGLREAYERADYEVESVGGRTLATPTTPRVLRLAGVEISVFTPEARRLVEDYCLEGEWLMELPLAGGTPSGARGYLFTVRFPDVVVMEDLEPPFTRSDHTFLHSTAEVEGPIDCLEVAEL